MMRKLISALGLLLVSSTVSAQYWSQVHTKTAPSPRWGHAMSYDHITGKTLLFGGVSQSWARGDTWEYDGATWTQLAPTTSPPGRHLSEMVHLKGTPNSLLFGGGRAGPDCC